MHAVFTERSERTEDLDSLRQAVKFSRIFSVLSGTPADGNWNAISTEQSVGSDVHKIRFYKDGRVRDVLTTNIKRFLCALIICASVATPAIAQQITAPEPQTGSISGTVVDVNNDIIPGATVVLEGPVTGEHRTVIADDSGGFNIVGLKSGISYLLTVSANGFVNWASPAINNDINSGLESLIGGQVSPQGYAASIQKDWVQFKAQR